MLPKKRWTKLKLVVLKVMNKLFVNIKNKKIYEVYGEVTNATNANDGQKMILYTDGYGNFYVREVKEFGEKFKQQPIGS